MGRLQSPDMAVLIPYGNKKPLNCTQMKVAFVHDWFNANGGAEKVAAEILEIYKEHDVTIYTLFTRFAPAERKAVFKNHKVKVSLLQYVPFISKFYRYFLPVM